jgi:hypothetical protein
MCSVEEDWGLSRLSGLAMRALGWARIGPVRVDAPREVAAGDRLRVRVRLKRDVRLDSVEIRLRAREFSHTFSLAAGFYNARSLFRPNGGWVLRSELAHLDIVDAEPSSDGDGNSQDYVGSFELPLNAPPTFSANHDALDWRVRVTCCRGRARIKKDFPLVVRPPRV